MDNEEDNLNDQNEAALAVLPKKFNFEDPPEKNKLTHKKSRRPVLFTPGRKQKIIQALSSGASIGTAAGFAGINRATLKRWIARGQSAGPNAKGVDYSLYKFSEDCIEANSKNALGYIGIPNKYLQERSEAGELDARDASLALDVLKVLHRDEYGTKKKEVKHAHEVKGSIEHRKTDLSSLTITQLKQLRDISKQIKIKESEDDIIDAEIVNEEKVSS